MNKKLMILLLLTAVFFPAGVEAQAGATLSVGPGRITAGQPLIPGHSYTLPVYTVSNESECDMEITVGVSHIRDELLELPPAEWFSIEPAELRVPAGEEGQVRVGVALPGDAPAGDYRVWLCFEGRPPGPAGLVLAPGIHVSFIFNVKDTGQAVPAEPVMITRSASFSEGLNAEQQRESLVFISEGTGFTESPPGENPAGTGGSEDTKTITFTIAAPPASKRSSSAAGPEPELVLPVIVERGDIVRTVTRQGKQRDTVIVDIKVVRKAVPVVKDTGIPVLELVVEKDAENPAAEVVIIVPAPVVSFLFNNNLSLQLTTSMGTLGLPVELLAVLSAQEQDLIIKLERMTPEQAERSRRMASSAGGEPLGDSTRISTNFSGDTSVTLLLEHLEIPADPVARQSFLDALAVFVHHRDDTTQTITGEIQYDEEGNPLGLSIRTDKFSVFVIVKLPGKEIVLTIGSRKALAGGVEEELDAPPFINPVVDRALGPARIVSGRLGADVQWLQETKQVRIKASGGELLFTIGSKVVLVNGREQILDCPAEIVNDRAFVPVRFLSENLGASVGWDGHTKTITIRKYW
jgi:hypothetical protein